VSDRLTLLELMVLMAIHGIEHDGKRAYGASIAARITRDSGRDIPLQSVYDCLKTLNANQCIRTWPGEASAHRGGRAPVLCGLLDRGKAILFDQLRELDFVRETLYGTPGRVAGAKMS
jgi:DNA-binding PadR family transcriptional regulator